MDMIKHVRHQTLPLLYKTFYKYSWSPPYLYNIDYWTTYYWISHPYRRFLDLSTCDLVGRVTWEIVNKNLTNFKDKTTPKINITKWRKGDSYFIKISTMWKKWPLKNRTINLFTISPILCRDVKLYKYI